MSTSGTVVPFLHSPGDTSKPKTVSGTSMTSTSLHLLLRVRLPVLSPRDPGRTLIGIRSVYRRSSRSGRDV